MRKRYNDILRAFFYNHLILTRYALKRTQAQMAKSLLMEARSYINLDHGKSGCSALTLVLYLLYFCEDPLDFLEKLRRDLENAGILSLIDHE